MIVQRFIFKPEQMNSYIIWDPVSNYQTERSIYSNRHAACSMEEE